MNTKCNKNVIYCTAALQISRKDDIFRVNYGNIQK